MKPSRTYETGSLLDGKFRILKVLGEGAMGTVYEVENVRLEKHFALKVLHTDEQTSPDAVKRFHTEIKAAGRIGNTHVVDVYDDGVLESGEPYVVMERLEGETLADLIKRKGRLGLAEMCDLVAQACDGAQAAHDAGIVHRDLKPANLFVTTREGKPFVKLLDFGISKFERDAAEDMMRTQEGTLIGTPYYMSPEQIRGRVDLDGGVDVYALGVILYECATGQVPYRANTLPMLGVLIGEGKPEPLGALRTDLPEVFRDHVARAMAVDRVHRTPSARNLGHVLRALVGQTDAGSTPIDEFAGRDWMQSTAIIEEPLDVKLVPLPRTNDGLSTRMPASRRRLVVALMLVSCAISGTVVAAVMVLPNKPFVENDAGSKDAGTNEEAPVVRASTPVASVTLSVPSLRESVAPSVSGSTTRPVGAVPAKTRSQDAKLPKTL